MTKPVRRSSFTPDALANFANLFDEVWNELALEQVISPTASAEPYRARLAQSVFRLARSPWSDIQIKQLLVRALRNDVARMERAVSVPILARHGNHL